MSLVSLLLSLLLPQAAFCYIPPSFYLYTHIAEQQSRQQEPSVAFSVSRPLDAGSEELLGSYSVAQWSAEQNSWPTLSLLFSNNSDALIAAVKAFGIPVNSEKSLLRVAPEQALAMKEAPRPFYKTDKLMGLKRFRNTYAWVHSAPGGDRSIWLEKDTFLPLKIVAPCPPGVQDLPWIKAGENICSVEFRNLYALRKGAYQNTKIILLKDDQPILYLQFDKIYTRKNNTGGDSNTKIGENLQEILHTILR